MSVGLDLLCEKSDGVATLTLNRPQRKNAMTPQMMCLLADAWLELEGDDEVRAVILTAQGHEAFCPGGDMEAMVPVITGSREPANEWERRFRADEAEIERLRAEVGRFREDVARAVAAAVIDDDQLDLKGLGQHLGDDLP